MARAFKRKGSRYVGRLSAGELGLVVGLLAQTRELVAPVVAEPTGDEFDDLVAGLGIGAEHVDPQERDPALERLLPSAHREDEQVAAEFRRLTEYGLRERKAANLDLAIESLHPVSDDRISLDRDQATAVLVSLTDVRLVLGERLGLRTDEDTDLLSLRLAKAVSRATATGEELEPVFHLAGWYDFLTWLQESLAHALAPRR